MMTAFQSLKFGRLTAGLIICVLLTCCSGCSEQGLVRPPPDEALRGGDFYPAWSPDGSIVAFMGEDIDSATQYPSVFLRMVDLASLKVTTVRPMNGLLTADLDWSPDGKWLVFTDFSGIYKILANGDSLTQLTSGEFHLSPSWSSVSNRIFFEINNIPNGGVFSINPDGTNLQRWTSPEQFTIELPFCFPNSDSLSGYTFDNNRKCLAIHYPGDTTISEIFGCDLLWVGKVKISSNRRFIVFSTTQAEPPFVHLFLFDRLDNTMRQLSPGKTERVFDVSPEGNRVVYMDRQTTRGLQIIDIASGRITQLTVGHP